MTDLLEGRYAETARLVDEITTTIDEKAMLRAEEKFVFYDAIGRHCHLLNWPEIYEPNAYNQTQQRRKAVESWLEAAAGVWFDIGGDENFGLGEVRSLREAEFVQLAEDIFLKIHERRFRARWENALNRKRTGLSIKELEKLVTPAMPSDGEFVVYKHLDRNRRCLYVGFSAKFSARQRAHFKAYRWWKNVAVIEVAVFLSREEALKAEEKAIRKLRPKWNLTHNPLGPVHP